MKLYTEKAQHIPKNNNSESLIHRHILAKLPGFKVKFKNPLPIQEKQQVAFKGKKSGYLHSLTATLRARPKEKKESNIMQALKEGKWEPRI